MENKIKLEKRYAVEWSVVNIGTQEVKVKKQITYKEKQELAQEYASAVCVIDEKQELAYEMYDVKAVWVYLFCKYYTNIDVEEFELDMDVLYDSLLPYMSDLTGVCVDDYCDAKEIADEYIYRTFEFYDKQHCLGQKIKVALGGILNGEDLLKTIAESRAVNEEMISLLTKAKMQDEQDQNVVMFPWAAKKD